MMVGRPTFGVARRGDGDAARRASHGCGCAACARRGRTRSRCAAGRQPRRSRRGRSWAWPASRATARRSCARCSPGCAARPPGRSWSTTSSWPARHPQRGHGGTRRAHPRGPPREPGAGPVRGRQPGAGARRRLPASAAGSTSGASSSTPGRSSSATPSRHVQRTGSAPCRAATSRRCSWHGCCRATRGSSSCRSRRAAWTSVPPSTSAPSCSRVGRRAPRSCSCRRTSTSCWPSRTGCVVIYEGRIVGELAR